MTVNHAVARSFRIQRRAALWLLQGLMSLLFVANAQAQAPFDLTGQWAQTNTVPEIESIAPLVRSLTIQQTTATLVVISRTPLGEARLVFQLDGSASRNLIRIPEGGGVHVSTARWQGDVLLIQDVAPDGTTTSVTIRHQIASGAAPTMRVEVERPNKRGPPTRVALLYRKQGR